MPMPAFAPGLRPPEGVEVGSGEEVDVVEGTVWAGVAGVYGGRRASLAHVSYRDVNISATYAGWPW